VKAFHPKTWKDFLGKSSQLNIETLQVTSLRFFAKNLAAFAVKN